MHKILVFTDTHIRIAGKTIAGLDPFAQFQRAFAHAIATHPDALRIIHMGDLAHSGQATEYMRAAQIMAQTQIPITLMAGNHDNRDALLDYFPDTPLCDGAYMQSADCIGQDLIITLDTLDGPPFQNDLHSGWLCNQRLDWLDQQLRMHPDKRVCIFMHHPPFEVGFAGMDVIALRNRADFLARLKTYPNPFHLFCGHIHRTISGSVDGIGFTIFKSTCHQAPLMFGIDDESASVAEPGAYGIVLLGGDAVIAHTEDFDLAMGYNGSEPDALPE